MLPIGPLMIEHRLIERMITLLRKDAERMDREQRIDAGFLDRAVEFMLNYADCLHHAKEEQFLFKELDKKDLPEDLRRIMSELIEEHRQARAAMLGIADAKARVLAGQQDFFAQVLSHARTLVIMYPRHVEKEDRHFFLPCMQFLTSEEKDAMLEREYGFDREVLHEIYREKVEREEKK
ncbi:MAG: hypothetical protein A2078_01105 [Nitrospirae bacterium GWC2_57_9]|nr:MAG: hypothetical protein A2078_01105 [Nitrospirae bacterium GWC2_57_9]